MAPPFLFLRNMTGGTAAVFRYDGSTPTQIGSTFGTLETATDNYMGKNRVIQFQNELYALQNLGVYKLQGDGTTWNFTGGLAFTSPSASGGSNVYRTGLHPITINGASYLICAYLNTTNELIIATMDAATNTWSETGAVTTFTPDTASDGGFFTEIVYENKFYLTCRQSSGAALALQYDPALDTLSNLTHPFPSIVSHMMDICIHAGRLFIIYVDSGAYRLAEFTGTQWTGLGGIHPSALSTSITLAQARLSLMSDGTNVYCMCPIGNVNFGWKCVQISDVDSLPGTLITSTVLPSALIASGEGGTGFADTDSRLVHVPDVQTNPGVPDHYFYFTQSATAGSSRQLYQWTGNASLMIAVGPTGGDVAHAIPTASAAGGERIFSAVASDNDILITERETVSGGIKCTLRAYSPSGTTTGTVRIWYTTAGEPVMSQAGLTGPVTGGSAALSGDTIINVTADGTTDYTVVVPAVANSFGNLDQVDLVPEFF